MPRISALPVTAMVNAVMSMARRDDAATDEADKADTTARVGQITPADAGSFVNGEVEKLYNYRSRLIAQYMYLITAPFLAIVTYYLLFMVEGKLAESIPIVVLVSFAAGLLSETVVEAICAVTSNYLSKLKAGLGSDSQGRDVNGSGKTPVTGA